MCAGRSLALHTILVTTDGTAAHRREVEATREFLGTGVMPTLERSWPLESDFLVVPDQQPPGTWVLLASCHVCGRVCMWGLKTHWYH